MAAKKNFKGFFATDAEEKIIREHSKKFEDNQSSAIRDLIKKGYNNQQSN